MTESDRLDMIERQKLWEMDGVERGVRRYRNELAKSLAAGNVADTPPGQRMMLAIMEKLVPAIEQLREEGHENLVDPAAGSRPAWAMPLLCLSAEKWAVITGRTVLAAEMSTRPTLNLALTIANAGRAEVEFENFKRAEAKKAKVDVGYTSLYDRMSRKLNTFSTRTVRKWMRKCGEFEKADWPVPIKLAVGGLLVDTIVNQGAGHFEYQVLWRMEKRRVTSQRVVLLTDLSKQYMNYHHAQSELTRPWLAPMICPPNDWRHVKAE